MNLFKRKPKTDLVKWAIETAAMLSKQHHAEVVQAIDATASAIYMKLTASDQPRVITQTLAAYALSLAHGGTLEPFERENIIDLAHKVGVVVESKLQAYAITRTVLDEVLKERRAQVEIHGHTPDDDISNPARLHQEVLSRVEQMPTPHVRKSLIEAAAILIAEIERIDRLAK